MSFRIPQRTKDLVPFAQELIRDCEASRQSRMQAGATWRSWWLLGSDTGIPARYNKCRTHIARLASYLYSPVDLQFSIEVEKSQHEQWKSELPIASSTLSREFHRRGLDISFGDAVEWSLVKGSCYVKQVWGEDGLDPWLVQPEMMGVLREDIDDLNRQEAFFHSSYLTPGMLRRMLTGRGDADKLMKKVKTQGKTGADDPAKDEMFKQVIIGGVNPVATSTTGNPAGGIVQWMSGPGADLAPHVLTELVRVDELWVQDTERQDWTTIQLVGEDIVLLGDMQHLNLCGIEGCQPFTRICANPMNGNIWGRSELANLWLIQDMLNKRIQGLEDVWRLQEDPPRAMLGGTAMTDERKQMLRQPGGWITEEQPGAKVEDMAPKLPEGAFEEINQLLSWFDDEGGMTPTLTGHGESGVRAQGHAETLVRTSSPQLRDRALLVERQLEDAGDFAFRMLQAHDATAFQVAQTGGTGGMMQGVMAKLGMGKEQQVKSFLLSQLPEDIHVSVDSHSASPAFSEEATRLAFALHQQKAISAPDLLRLTPVQHKDTLIAAAIAREEAQAQLVKEHPELLVKGGKGR